MSILIFTTTLMLVTITGSNIHGDRNGNNENGTLVLLHVLFRHGERTPLLNEIYPNDPYINYTYPPFGYGQLTDEGRQKVFLIGKALRQRYGSYLENLTPLEVIAQTTNYTRTKESCRLVLAALYSLQNESDWKRAVTSNKAECVYQSHKDNKILGHPKVYCPAFNDLFQEQSSALKGQEIYTNNKQFYDYILNATGRNSITADEASELYYLLKSQDVLHLKLPDWTKSIWPEILSVRAADKFYIYTATDRMKRITLGYLLEKILQDTEHRITNTQKVHPKLHLYAAHDTNIAFLLMSLGQFKPHIPPYGSYVVFELRKIGEVYGFKIFYQDYCERSAWEPFNLDGCGTFCRSDKFKDLVSRFLPLPTDCTLS